MVRRFIYVDNAHAISSYTPLFSGQYTTLDEVKSRLADFIPTHSNLSIEFYNKRLGMAYRKQLDLEVLPSDLENIHVYLRSRIQAVCSVCSGDGGHNHAHT